MFNLHSNYFKQYSVFTTDTRINVKFNGFYKFNDFGHSISLTTAFYFDDFFNLYITNFIYTG